MVRHRLTLPLTLVLALLTASCSFGGDGSAQKQAKPTPTPTPTVAPPEGAITPDFFGMHDHNPVGPSWPDAPIGSYRVWDAGAMWRDIETAPGAYDFQRLDAIVDTAEQHQADVIVVLGQTPLFHAVQPNADGFYGAGAPSPPTLESWTAYVRALAERYAGRPVSYQVWNEANVKGFWRGTPAEMAQLTKAARDVLATVSPQPALIAPAFVLRLIGQRAWFDSFWAERVDGVPVADLVDAVSLQLYPDAEGTPQTAMDLLAYARTVLANHGVDKPIWNTEVNYGLSGLEVDPAPVAQQKANVAQTLLLNAANKVARVYWYGWDQRTIVDTLLTREDGVARTAAGRAYGRVHEWLLDGAVEGCTEERSTWACTVRRADGIRRIYWSDAPFAVLRLPPQALTYQDLSDPPRLVTAGTVLPLGPAPVMVASRS